MSTQTEGPVIPQWTISDRLRKARDFAGLDQDELAEAIEVSRGTISNYEAGKVKPRRIVLRQWALRTAVPLDWLMTGDPDGDELPRLDSNQQPAGYSYKRYTSSSRRTRGAKVAA